MKNEKLQNILFKDSLTKSDANYLLNLTDDGEINLLFKRADQLRKDYCGDEVHFRGAISISNNCLQNCNYCGMRNDNYAIKRFRMEPDEILKTALIIAKHGINTIVLKSGEDDQLDTDVIAYLIYSIKNSVDVAVSLSFGERGFDEYMTWKIAGADRYILRHESCDKQIGTADKTKNVFLDRIKHLKYLKRLGYEIGSGGLIGLPNQKTSDIIEDIFMLKEIDADTAFFSPFIPSPFTPYRNMAAGDSLLTLKAIAVARIALKNVHLQATTAFDTIEQTGREKALSSGANVIVPDFTPLPYRNYFKTYPDRRYNVEDPILASKHLQKRIEKLGRHISFSRGDSLKNPAVITL